MVCIHLHVCMCTRENSFNNIPYYTFLWPRKINKLAHIKKLKSLSKLRIEYILARLIEFSGFMRLRKFFFVVVQQRRNFFVMWCRWPCNPLGEYFIWSYFFSQTIKQTWNSWRELDSIQGLSTHSLQNIKRLKVVLALILLWFSFPSNRKYISRLTQLTGDSDIKRDKLFPVILYLTCLEAFQEKVKVVHEKIILVVSSTMWNHVPLIISSM